MATYQVVVGQWVLMVAYPEIEAKNEGDALEISESTDWGGVLAEDDWSIDDAERAFIDGVDYLSGEVEDEEEKR